MIIAKSIARDAIIQIHKGKCNHTNTQWACNTVNDGNNLRECNHKKRKDERKVQSYEYAVGLQHKGKCNHTNTPWACNTVNDGDNLRILNFGD